ncbi:MAG: zinc-binding alcohol dehydrogenase family protein [Thermoproteota archaeon]
MKAISIHQPKVIKIVEIPEPKMRPDELLIEIRYVGLCGSDLSAYRGISPFVTYPRIPGHEASGIIISKGEEVPENVKIGAAVTSLPYTNCGTCPSYKLCRFNACQYNQTLGVQRDGALNERISIPYRKVYSSDVLTLQELALVEPLSIGYHATNRGRVSEADTVLVLGCGAIGLGAIAAASQKGADVIAVDIEDRKLANAINFGARNTINLERDDISIRMRDLTKGEGASVVIEAVGSPQTFRMAIEQVSFAGRVVFIGYTKEEVSLQTNLIVSKELDVYGSRNALNVFSQVIRMMEERRKPFKEMISSIIHFRDAAKAFAEWDSSPQKFTKILIELQG